MQPWFDNTNQAWFDYTNQDTAGLFISKTKQMPVDRQGNLVIEKKWSYTML